MYKYSIVNTVYNFSAQPVKFKCTQSIKKSFFYLRRLHSEFEATDYIHKLKKDKLH